MGGKEFKKIKKAAKMENIKDKKHKKGEIVYKENKKDQTKDSAPAAIISASKKIKKDKVKITDGQNKGKISTKAGVEAKNAKIPINKAKQIMKNQQKKVKSNDKQDKLVGAASAEISTTLPSAPPMSLSNFSQDVFTDLTTLSKPTKEALKKLKYFNLTKVQSKILPELLQGKDIHSAAPANSGKTLAVVLAAVEQLTHEFQQSHGTGAIIIAPTNIEAQGTFKTAKLIVSQHSLTLGLLLSERSKEQQAIRLVSGVNILIATPKALLYHLKHTKGFNVSNLKSLFVLKADKLVELGIADSLVKVSALLPQVKQTAVIAKVLSKPVKELARSISSSNTTAVVVNLQKESEISQDEEIAVEEEEEEQKEPIKQHFEHGYAIIEADKKLRLLYTFLEKQKKDKKIIVFISSCNGTQFLADVFNNLQLSVQCLHTRQTQKERFTILGAFSAAASSSILLCSEAVYKGQNIPHADWFIQYDPPQDAHHYIQIATEICSASPPSSPGKAIIFLLPEESQFMKLLADMKLSSTEFSFPQHKLANIQEQVDNLVERNYFFNKSATEAFRAYLQSYSQHSLKDIFNISNFDVLKVCRSFGFVMPPRINNLGVKLINKQLEKKVQAAQAQQSKNQS